MHDPFPRPFTDEVLEGVGEQDMYSFTDIFYAISPDKDHKRGSPQDNIHY